MIIIGTFDAWNSLIESFDNDMNVITAVMVS